MARYFFGYVEGGNLSHDDDGIELATATDARAEAGRALGEYIVDRAKRGRSVDVSIVVRDNGSAIARFIARVDPSGAAT